MPKFHYTAEEAAKQLSALASLQAQHPGRRHSYTEIARAAGVSDMSIIYTERSAFRKLRHRLRHELQELTS